MDDKIVYQFSRNDGEQIMFSIRQYKDKRYLDIRMFYQPKPDEQYRPTKKGITIPLELTDEMANGIKRVQAVSKTGGLK